MKNNVFCHSTYDTKTQKYQWNICIPWKVLIGKRPKVNDSLGFNIAVGDNDDGIMQKAKIAWRGNSDPLTKVGADFGLVKLVNQVDENLDTTKIFSQMRRLSTLPDSLEWAKFHAFDINKLVLGSIDPDDNLSAQLKSCWDNVNLYFYLEVNDAKKGFAKVDIIKRSDTFHDYGWIEDDNGKVIWKMNVLYSRPAGGALKNQQIDTVINLKPGKYHLKYLTDESHNWNNWDDRAPKTNFAGIVLYRDK